MVKNKVETKEIKTAVVFNQRGELIGRGTLEKKDDDGNKVILKRFTYKGPIPSTTELKKYNELYPRAAEIILRDFERISKHRIDYNQKALEAQIKLDRLSQWQGFIVATIMLIGAVVCAYFKATEIGIGLVGASVLGIIRAILPNKK